MYALSLERSSSHPLSTPPERAPGGDGGGKKILNKIYIYGQESPGWISLFKLVTFFLLLLKISRKPNFFGKIYWSMNSGRRRAGDNYKYLKNYFHFQNSTKNGNKVETI